MKIRTYEDEDVEWFAQQTFCVTVEKLANDGYVDKEQMEDILAKYFPVVLHESSLNKFFKKVFNLSEKTLTIRLVKHK